MTTRDTQLQAVAQFHFGPPPDGYSWIDAPHPQSVERTTRWLVSSQRAAKAGWFTTLELGDEEASELFLEFARLDLSEESLLAFANRYGCLGIPQIIPGSGVLRGGELVADWRLEVLAMRSAVDLSRAVSRQERSKLRTWLSFGPRGQLTFDRRFDDGSAVVWTIKDGHSPVAPHVEAGRWSKAGRLVLHEMLNKRLVGGTRAGVVYDSKREQLSFRIIIESLVAAMWMQLANVVALDRVGRCQACGSLLVSTPGVSRSDRKTCSDACRAKLSRAKRARKKGAKRGARKTARKR